MDREQRKADISIPENLKEMLNNAQRQALPGVKFLGWEPRFLRKELFKAPLLVMYNSRDGRLGKWMRMVALEYKIILRSVNRKDRLHRHQKIYITTE